MAINKDFIVKNGLAVLAQGSAQTTSTTTGAIVTPGGIGLGGNLYAGGDIHGQNLFVNNTIQSTGGNLYLTTGTSGSVIANGVDLLYHSTTTVYVAINGSDSSDGQRPISAFATIGKALSVATTGTEVVIDAGTYVETFPLTVPKGVTVRGAGLRSTIVTPTLATNTQTGFLMNGESLITDLTVSGFYKPGYAFAFAQNCNITTKSPYLQRVSVITKGSVTSATDPYGYSQGDAGNGVYLDASVLASGSLEPAMLFNEVTFIVPNATGMYMTNGVRAELLNGFFYFANKAVNAQTGATGVSGAGKTRLKLGGVSGTFNATDTITYKNAAGTTLATGTISSASNGYIYLNGPVWGFQTDTSAPANTITPHNGAAQSTIQKKFGASSLSLNGSQYLTVPLSTEFTIGTNDFTVETWVYRTTNPTQTEVLIDFRTINPEVVPTLSISSTYYPVLTVNGTAVITGSLVIPFATWSHVAISRTGTTTTMFVDGVSVGSFTDTNNYLEGFISIGARYDSTLKYTGYLDDLRITNGLGRYTTNFTPPASELTADGNTVLLLNFNGGAGSTTFIDSSLGYQNVYSSSGGTASQIVLADYHQFGAELRCIGSAAVFGNQGVIANGTGTDLKLIAFNMSFIGAQGDLTDDASLVVQTNEVIQTNGGKVYYQTVDQNGDFRVGSQFLVNQQTGNVSFGNSTVNLTTVTSLTITDGTHSTILQPTSISVGNLSLSGNSLVSSSGDININPSSGNSTVDGNLQVDGTLGASGIVSFTNLTNATSTNTGALQLLGGAGIAQDLWVGGAIYSNGSQVITSASLGSYGVSEILAGTGVHVNTATGNVTISIGQEVSTTSNVTFGTVTSTGAVTDSGNRVLTAVNISTQAGLSVISESQLGSQLSYVLANTGVTTATGSTYLGVSTSSGAVTFTNLGVNTLNNTDGFIGISNSTGSVILQNLGVTSLTGGHDITVSASTGSITINDTSTLESVTTRGATTDQAISITNSTNASNTFSGALIVTGGVGIGGNVYATNMFSNGSQVITAASLGNYGVSSITGGAGISVNTATGAVTISNTGVTTATGSTYIGVSGSNGNVTFTNLGVTTVNNSTGSITISAGTDTAVSSSAGNITLWDTSTLQSVSSRGATTNQALSITNATDSSNASSGALQVAGGVGIGSTLFVGGDAHIVGNLYVDGTNTIVNSTSIQTGDKTITLSSATVLPTLAVDSGLKVGPNGSYINWLFDGLNSWKTSGGILVNSTQTASSTNTGALQVLGGVGIGGSLYASNMFSNGSQVVTSASLGSYGVSAITAGTGISVNTATGNVTITNIGVTSVVNTDGFISVSNGTGTVTLSNLGVTKVNAFTGNVDVIAGSSIGVVTATNQITINNLGVTSIDGNTGSVSIKKGIAIDVDITVPGTITINNIGVQSVTGGTDITVSTSTGSVTINDASTLQSVSSRGATSNQIILLTNNSAASSTNSGALQVFGGVGIGGALYAGNMYSNGNQVVTSASLGSYGVSAITAGTGISVNTATGSVTVTNTGVTTATGSTYIGVSSGSGNVTFTNLGVTNLSGSTYLGISNSTGSVTLTNLGVTNISVDNNLAITTSTGSVSISFLGTATTATNLAGGIYGEIPFQLSAGSTSFDPTFKYDSVAKVFYTVGINVGATGVTTTGTVTANQITAGSLGINTTGTVTVSNNTAASSTNSGALQVTGGVGVGGSLYAGNIYSNGSQVLTYGSLAAAGVTAITAGTDTAISTSSGAVTIWDTSTLNSVTGRGNSTTHSIFVNNATVANSTNSGALQIQGGAGIGGALYVGNNLSVAGSVVSNLHLTNNLYVDGNIYASSNILNLSTASTTTSLSANSGISVGPSSSPYASFLFDGYGDWISVGNILPSNTANYGLGSLGDPWNLIYGNEVFDSGNRVVTSVVPNPGTGIAITGLFQNGPGATFTVTNVGVTSLYNGSDIGLTGNTGSVTVSVTSTLQSVTGRGNSTTNVIVINTATVSTSTNSNQALLVTGGIGAHQLTADTVNATTINGGAVYDSGSRVLTQATIANYGVSQILAGTDTSVSTTSGVVTVWNTATLQSVTGRGSTTNQAINITNNTSATSTNTGALQVAGGAGVGGSLYVGGTGYFAGDLYVDGTQFIVNSQTISSGDKTLTLSTSSTSAALATNSGLQIGSTSSPYISWLFDGIGNWISTGGAQFNGTTPALSTNSGALQVAGGAGIGGALYVGGAIYSQGSAVITSASLGSYGVSNINAGVGISVNTGTGNVTVSNTGVTTATGSTYIGVSTSSGNVVFTNLGVTNLTGGTDITVSTSTGSVTINDASTLQSVTSRGATTNNAISITTSTKSTSVGSGALIITGGLSAGDDSYFGGKIYLNGTNTLSPTINISGSFPGVNINPNNAINTYAGFNAINVNDPSNNGFTIGSQPTRPDSATLWFNSQWNGTPSTYAGDTLFTFNTATATLRISHTGIVTVYSTATSSSTSTGALVVGGGVGIGGTVYASNMYSNGSQVITLATLANYGVSTITAGTDTSVSTSSGNVVIWNTSTLQSVTGRGATTNNAINITNNTISTSSTTGALIVSGGAGFGGPVVIANTLTIQSVGSLVTNAISPFSGNTVSFSSNISASGIINTTNASSSISTNSGALQVAGGAGIGGTLNVGGNANVLGNEVITGTLTHGGLVPSAGTNIDQIYTTSTSLTLSTSWQNTGIVGTQLTTGTYMIQVLANDSAVGGGEVNTYYSGVMSWYGGADVDTTYDEIVLHRAGSASGSGTIFLQVQRSLTTGMTLQIAGATANTGPSTYNFSFRRMI